MNIERINFVADAIEQHTLDLGFNMCYFVGETGDRSLYGRLIVDKSGHNCGTTACIAGWVRALALNTVNPSELASANINEAEWLGLYSKEAWNLFYAANRDAELDLSMLTQEQAVRTLRHLASTGTVNWTV